MAEVWSELEEIEVNYPDKDDRLTRLPFAGLGSDPDGEQVVWRLTPAERDRVMSKIREAKAKAAEAREKDRERRDRLERIVATFREREQQRRLRKAAARRLASQIPLREKYARQYRGKPSLVIELKIMEHFADIILALMDPAVRPEKLVIRVSNLGTRWNRLRDASLDGLLDVLAEPSLAANLRHLELDDHALGDDKASQVLEAAMQLEQLHTLVLSQNQMSDQVADSVAALISNSKSLRRLDISRNNFTKDGARVLRDCLQNGHSLVALNLNDCYIGQSTLKGVARLMNPDVEGMLRLDGRDGDDGGPGEGRGRATRRRGRSRRTLAKKSASAPEEPEVDPKQVQREAVRDRLAPVVARLGSAMKAAMSNPTADRKHTPKQLVDSGKLGPKRKRRRTSAPAASGVSITGDSSTRPPLAAVLSQIQATLQRIQAADTYTSVSRAADALRSATDACLMHPLSRSARGTTPLTEPAKRVFTALESAISSASPPLYEGTSDDQARPVPLLVTRNFSFVRPRRAQDGKAAKRDNFLAPSMLRKLSRAPASKKPLKKAGFWLIRQLLDSPDARPEFETPPRGGNGGASGTAGRRTGDIGEVRARLAAGAYLCMDAVVRDLRGALVSFVEAAPGRGRESTEISRDARACLDSLDELLDSGNIPAPLVPNGDVDAPVCVVGREVVDKTQQPHDVAAANLNDVKAEAAPPTPKPRPLVPPRSPRTALLIEKKRLWICSECSSTNRRGLKFCNSCWMPRVYSKRKAIAVKVKVKAGDVAADHSSGPAKDKMSDKENGDHLQKQLRGKKRGRARAKRATG